MNIYYSTLALCGLVGLLSNSFLLHAAAWAVAIAVMLGRVILENMSSYDH